MLSLVIYRVTCYADAGFGCQHPSLLASSLRSSLGLIGDLTVPTPTPYNIPKPKLNPHSLLDFPYSITDKLPFKIKKRFLHFKALKNHIMASPVTSLEYRGKVAIITIDNQKKLNALTQDQYYEIACHMREVATREDIFVTLLTAKGELSRNTAIY